MSRRPDRHRWSTALPALLLLAAGAAGCHASPGESSDWLRGAETLLTDSHPTTEGLHVGDQAERLRVSRLLDEAPAEPTAAEAATLGRLTALRDFYATIDTAAATADTRSAATAPAVRRIAADSLIGSVRTDLTDYLVERGGDILRDTACDLAWAQMRPDERTGVGSLYDTGYTRAVPEEVEGLGTMTREAATGALEGAVRAEFLKHYLPTGLVDWAGYVQGLYDKAVEVVADGPQLIDHPDGGAVTHALIYYARLCLVPPK